MASLAPVTTPGITDRYLADKIFGFPVGPALLMASEGQASTVPDDFASEFDHDFEVSTPYYYEADLLTWGIKAELTATPESAYYRFTYPAGKHSQLLLSLTKAGSLHRQSVAVVRHGPSLLGHRLAALFVRDCNRLGINFTHTDRVIRLAGHGLVPPISLHVDLRAATGTVIHALVHRKDVRLRRWLVLACCCAMCRQMDFAQAMMWEPTTPA